MVMVMAAASVLIYVYRKVWIGFMVPPRCGGVGRCGAEAAGGSTRVGRRGTSPFAAEPARRDAIIVHILAFGLTVCLGRLHIAHVWRQCPAERSLFRERLAMGDCGMTLTSQRKRDILWGKSA